MFKKLNIQKAERLFYEGKDVYLVPSNINPDFGNMWIKPYLVSKVDECGDKVDFRKQVNAYSYYNCCSELGDRVHYYIKE